jgi:hypothetical protein
MTELHAGLKLFRDQLRDAVARDLAPSRGLRAPRRRRALLLASAAGAAVAGAALVAGITGSSPVPSADAAIMRHVVAALTAPPATILHERAMVTLGSTTQPFELWTESQPPYRYRVIKWGEEGTGTGRAASDPAATLRSMVASGQAHVDAATTFHGVPAYRLTVSGAPDRWLNGTAYVSRSNYHPLEIDTTTAGPTERIVYQAYEYLPATSANQALLSR